jgi:hypothetical protein
MVTEDLIDLLVKYMAVVIDHEGVSYYMEYAPPKYFRPEELETLKQIELHAQALAYRSLKI